MCRDRAENGAWGTAKDIAAQAMPHANRDLAYDDLQAWATWQEQVLELASRRSAERAITHPRLARPDGRVNQNPYLPRA